MEDLLMDDHLKEVELYFELKGTPEASKESYFRRIKAFLAYVGDKQPEDITQQDIQQYILYLKKERGLSAGTTNNYISAIRFFYTHVLDKEWNARRVPRMKRYPILPVILPKEDVLALIDATTNVKHKAIIALLYGSGLRVSEAAALRIRDIDSKTMRVRIEQAKHGTVRYTILSEAALHVLREYFKGTFSGLPYQMNDWLFPGQNHHEHINVKTIKNTMIKLRDKLQIDQRVSSHTLRHCFATHALEDGVDPVYVQQMLGHKNFKTTAGYLHMTSKSLMGIRSPLDTGQQETQR